eukprot:730765_1
MLHDTHEIIQSFLSTSDEALIVRKTRQLTNCDTSIYIKPAILLPDHRAIINGTICAGCKEERIIAIYEMDVLQRDIIDVFANDNLILTVSDIVNITVDIISPNSEDDVRQAPTTPLFESLTLTTV